VSDAARVIGPVRLLPPGLVLVAGLIIAATLLPWLKFVLTIALAKGLAVMGIMLLLRAGQVSFGHALFVAVAAYAAAFAAQQARFADIALLLPLGIVAAGSAGLLVGLFVARYRDIFFGMLNLAFSMVFYSLLEKAYHITKGTDGIRVPLPTVAGQVLDRVAYEWVMFAVAVVLACAAAWLCHRYLLSPAGQALRGIKTRETRLEFAGLSARRVLLLAYVLSAALAGAGGAIIACATRHVTPLLSYWTASGELVFIAILGGAGSVLGPLLGAVVFELVRVYAAATFAGTWHMILGAVLLGIILFAARGLWGIYEDVVTRRVGA
jgi:branched-chain amino acid transport system permease protein